MLFKFVDGAKLAASCGANPRSEGTKTFKKHPN